MISWIQSYSPFPRKVKNERNDKELEDMLNEREKEKGSK